MNNVPYISQGDSFTDVRLRGNFWEIMSLLNLVDTYYKTTFILSYVRALNSYVSSYNVKVLLSKTESTYIPSKRKIYLSINPLKSNVKQIGLPIITGLFAHEFGHVLYTKEPPKNKIGSQIWRAILNIVEDERIEKLLIKEHYGIAKFLPWAKEFYFKDRYVYPTGNALEDKLNIVLHTIRYPENITTEILQAYPEFTKEFFSLLDPYPQTFNEAVELTDKIFELLRNEIKELKDEFLKQLITLLMQFGGCDITNVNEEAEKEKQVKEANTKINVFDPYENAVAIQQTEEAKKLTNNNLTGDEDFKTEIIKFTKEDKEGYKQIVNKNQEIIKKYRGFFNYEFRNNKRFNRGQYYGDFDDDALVNAYISAKNV